MRRAAFGKAAAYAHHLMGGERIHTPAPAGSGATRVRVDSGIIYTSATERLELQFRVERDQEDDNSSGDEGGQRVDRDDRGKGDYSGIEDDAEGATRRKSSRVAINET